MPPTIAREVIRRYRDGETDAVFVLNNEFKSVMSQKLSVMQLLPVNLRRTTQRNGQAITSTSSRRSKCWSG